MPLGVAERVVVGGGGVRIVAAVAVAAVGEGHRRKEEGCDEGHCVNFVLDALGCVYSVCVCVQITRDVCVSSMLERDECGELVERERREADSSATATGRGEGAREIVRTVTAWWIA